MNYLSSFINSGIHKNKSFQRVKTLEAVRVGVGDAELVAAEQVTTPRLQPTGLAGCVSHHNGAGCWCVAQSVMWFVQLLVAPLAFTLGAGTACAYSPIMACVASRAEPSWQACALGAYRFWRDLGYAVGAVLLGRSTDSAGSPWAARGGGRARTR